VQHDHQDVVEALMNSAQLDLFEAELKELPWRGQSPRALTKAAKSLFLRQEPPKSMSEFVDLAQYEIWPIGQRAPRHSRGAPSLLPLPRR